MFLRNVDNLLFGIDHSKTEQKEMGLLLSYVSQNFDLHVAPQTVFELGVMQKAPSVFLYFPTMTSSKFWELSSCIDD